jgi:hypothetical protein
MLLQVLGPVTVTGDDGAQAQFRPRARACPVSMKSTLSH